ncbi:hypothetical protein NUW58_g567 [Xylaria curta]|uniref:Uncharacterized protein n=1 Tax=Xylaria curta TaxID=42375 RepID=A0ACC1PRB3_9PEZI|nr:hypothetical protein NUW58_g567 [Xylaria curta]
MQINALFGVLFAATASAAAINGTSDFVYYISGLTGFCAPDAGHVCGYGFRVTPSTLTTKPGPICGNIWPSDMVDGTEVFPTTPLVACFEDPSFSYAVTVADEGFVDGGLTLSVTSALDEKTNLTGSFYLPATYFTFERNDLGYTPIYLGPQNITMTKIVKVAV